eukprot:TCONS_00045695-protein
MTSLKDCLLLLVVVVSLLYHLSSAHTIKKYGSLRKCNGVCLTLNRDCLQKALKTNYYKLVCDAINRYCVKNEGCPKASKLLGGTKLKGHHSRPVLTCTQQCDVDSRFCGQFSRNVFQYVRCNINRSKCLKKC